MKTAIVVFSLFILFAFGGQLAFSQSGRAKPAATPTPQSSGEQKSAAKTASEIPQNNKNQTETIEDVDEVLRVETNLVTVPVNVLDKDGKYVPDLRREDFHLFENGVEQEIAFFASVDKPFTVALVLDMSSSTGAFRRDIQTAANAFCEQLRPNDRAMIIAFTGEIHFLSKPTGDHADLRTAIFQTNFLTGGTALYEAVDFTLHTAFKGIRGRKAMVIFTDGMDTASKSATLKGTLRDAEEAEVLIYPIQYDTLAFTNRTAGKNGQPQSRSGLLPILNAPGMPAPPNFPFPVPQNKRAPAPSRRAPTPGKPMPLPRPQASEKISALAGDYLNALAQKTGARLYRADKIKDISASFGFIAEELRHQYSIGFYPQKTAEQEETRQLKVRVERVNTAVRARASYIARPEK